MLLQRTERSGVQVLTPPLRFAEFGFDRYLSGDRRLQGVYEGVGHDAGRHHQRGEGFQPARAWRRWLSDRDEVELRAADFAQAEVHRGQCRRERTGHLQRPRADGIRSAPVDRRHSDRRSGSGRAQGLDLYSRRISLPDRHHGSGAWRRRTPKVGSGKNIQGTGFDFDLYTHSGAGAYECGEESALLESFEGKRGIPRIRPPFPAVVGVFQCPTVLNNVETFCAVPPIILDGGQLFAGLGTPKDGGTRLFCLSGHMNKPGVYELRMGFKLKQMIEEVGGGMRNGKKLKALIPGGSSCPVLKAEECEASPWITIPWRREVHAGLGRRGDYGRRYLHGEGGAAHHASSTRMKAAAGAFRVVRAPPG